MDADRRPRVATAGGFLLVVYLEPASVAWMYQVADHVIYPSRSDDPTAARSTVVA